MINPFERVDSNSTVLNEGIALQPNRNIQPTARFASGLPTRPAWVEIDLGQLKRNFQLIRQDKPATLQILSVVKDEAYGHGALRVAQTALESGARFLALATLEEAITLRDRGVKAR